MTTGVFGGVQIPALVAIPAVLLVFLLAIIVAAATGVFGGEGPRGTPFHSWLFLGILYSLLWCFYALYVWYLKRKNNRDP